LALSHGDRWGVFRTGIWYEWAFTNRYQTPDNPATLVDALLPNFHEKFITNSVQPFAEYGLRATRRLTVTAGVKLAYYTMDLNQYQDNGKIVGCLGGSYSGPTSNPLTTCSGPEFTTHGASYNSLLPSLDLNYRLKDNWSAYAQYAAGSIIPPSSVFDVKNATVETLPNQSRTNTYQIGTVFKTNRVTFDVDSYYIRFQNAYTSYIDPVTSDTIYVLPGDSITKGVELETNIFIAHGVSLYLNGTAGEAKYAATGRWVANTPKNTETVGLAWQRKNWDVGFFNKRVGQMYNDNGTTNQAVYIDPFNLTNLYFNYTFKNESHLRGTKIRVSMNNLFNNHNIVGVTPASTTTSLPSPNDQLNILPGRSVSLTMTFGYAPER